MTFNTLILNTLTYEIYDFLQGKREVLCVRTITVEYGQLITKKYLSEHKVITAEQQFLGLILCFFMYLKWPWLLCLFAVLL